MARWNPTFTEEELQNEEWRDVVGYEGTYSVSTLGRVRRDRAGGNTHAGRILAMTPTDRGYLTVKLHADPLPECRKKAHRLVAETFIGACPEGFEVNHLDGDKKNNRVQNLEYRTHFDNVRHAIEVLNSFAPTRARGSRSGSRTHPEKVPRGDNHYARTHPERLARGERGGRARLTEADVHIIRLVAPTTATAAIAKRFRVSPPTIRRILIGKTWRHI